MNGKIKKGKILRIKHGFNPNSSSIGSIIFSLPVALMAVTFGFSAASALISPLFLGNREQSGGSGEAPGRKVDNQEAPL